MGNTLIELERDVPDLEDLAAYLDGRLSTERKALVEERLLRDEDFYDVYRETMEFQQEQAQADGANRGGDVVTPAVWWRSWKVIAPAIAATLLMAFAIQRLMLGPSTNVLVARLNAATVIGLDDWDIPGWRNMRSGNPVPIYGKPEETAFRIGIRTVDLRVALAAKDRDNAKTYAAHLAGLTSSDDLFLWGMPREYEDLRKRLEDEELSALTIQAVQLEKSLENFLDSIEADRYALGRWNETGRLAAMAKDTDSLKGIWRRRSVALGIDEIKPQIDELEIALEALTSKVLRWIRTIKSFDSLESEPDFKAAEKAFEKIAYELAGPG